jgi:hypothetical protein
VAEANAPVRLRGRARANLASVPGAIQEQGGDNHTFVVVYRLVRDFGLADSDAFDLIREWNRTCSPPWSDRELQAKLGHARRYGEGLIGSKVAQDGAGWRSRSKPASGDGGSNDVDRSTSSGGAGGRPTVLVTNQDLPGVTTSAIVALTTGHAPPTV